MIKVLGKRPLEPPTPPIAFSNLHNIYLAKRIRMLDSTKKVVYIVFNGYIITQLSGF